MTDGAPSLATALREQGYVIVPVSGISMLPLLRDSRDLVRIRPATATLSPYDMALYKKEGGGYTLHRVIRVHKRYYECAGDNNRTTEAIAKARVIGVADGYFRDGAFVSCDDGDYRAYVTERCRNIANREIYTGNEQIAPEWRYLIMLLRSALSDGKVVPAPDSLDFKRLYAVAARQSIAASVAPCVAPTAENADILAAFAEARARNLRKEILFDAERQKIFALFDERGIAYVPLKGIILRRLYPGKGSREFADNDILYDRTRMNDVREIMEKLGYRTKSVDRHIHDVYLKAPFYNFEMHRALLPKTHPLYPYFKDIDKRLLPDGGTCAYRMSDTDLYLYTVAHIYTHDTLSGTGLRSVADLRLLRTHLESIGFNFDPVNRILQKYGLSEYYDHLLRVERQLFDCDGDALSYYLLSRVFRSGTYGTMETRVENALREKSSIAYLISRVFPPYDAMASAHPTLRRLPVLLPFFWLSRQCGLLFSSQKRRRAANEWRYLRQFRKSGADDADSP